MKILTVKSMEKKMFVWLDHEDTSSWCCVNPEAYGCRYYTKEQTVVDAIIAIELAEQTLCQKFVIHMDDKSMQLLRWLRSTGRTTANYEVRVHGSSEDAVAMRYFIDNEWVDKTGWFRS